MNNITLKKVWLPALVGVLAAVVAVQGVALYRLNSRMTSSEPKPDAKPVITLTQKPAPMAPKPAPSPKVSVPIAPKQTRTTDPFGFDMFASDPFAEMQKMEQRMNAMFKHAFAGARGMGSFFDDGFGGFADTQADIEDQSDSYVVRMKVPGDGKNAKINVSIDEDILTISGSHELNNEDNKNGNVVLYERSSGSFERSISLPGPVDASRIKTKMEDGELVVTLPKLGHGKPHRSGTMT